MLYGERTGIERYFKLTPIRVFTTDGMGLGSVLKFKTFYLKIYNEQFDTYFVQAFLNIAAKTQLPLFQFTVNTINMRSAFDCFSEDNFLIGVDQKLKKLGIELTYKNDI